MTTKEYNKGRARQWIKQFNLDKSRIFLIIGMKENGSFTFVTDEASSVKKVSETLKELGELVEKYPNAAKKNDLS